MNEINNLVAVHVNGWHRVINEFYDIWVDADDHLRTDVHKYTPSTSIVEAWEIAEDNKYHFTIEAEGDGMWSCCIGKDMGETKEGHPIDTYYWGTANTAAKAICIASLKSEGIEV